MEIVVIVLSIAFVVVSVCLCVLTVSVLKDKGVKVTLPHIPEITFKSEESADEKKARILSENIEKYNGTSEGQVKI